MQELKDKVAVVTGAASGIGLATARRFAQEGMQVVMADIQRDALDNAINQLSVEGFSVLGVSTDVSKIEDIQNLADAAIDAFGQVNVVHNNAGVMRAGSIEELSLADWQWVLGVDLWSVIYGVKVFLPLIRQAGEGHIINTASTTGLQCTNKLGPYNVAKFGVVAMTETLQMELEGENSPIAASVLCPGATNTQICQSERNRPDEAPSNPTHDGFVKVASPAISDGLQPDVVADLVVNAIKKQEFWILPHPNLIGVLEERVAAMRGSRKLVTGHAG